eukprot:gene9462-1668_t
MRLSSELSSSRRARKLSSVSLKGNDYDVMDMSLSEIIKLAATKPDAMTYQLISAKIQKEVKYLSVIKAFEKKGGFKLLNQLLEYEDANVRKRAAAACCNIAADEDPQTSLYLRKNETIDFLFDILDEDYNPEVNTIKVINNVCAALFNICLIVENRIYIVKKIKNLSAIIAKCIEKYHEFSDILKNLLLLCAFLALNPSAIEKLSEYTLDLIIEIFYMAIEEDVIEACVLALKSFSFDLQSRIKMVADTNFILKLLTLKRDQNKQISTSVKAIMDLLSLNEKNELELDYEMIFPKLRSSKKASVEEACQQLQAACNSSVTKVITEGAIEHLDYALNKQTDMNTLEEILKTFSLVSSNDLKGMALKYLTKLETIKRIYELLSMKIEMSLEFVEYAFITLENILLVKENRICFLSNNYMKRTLKFLKIGTTPQTKCSICFIISRLDEEFNGNKEIRNEKAIDKIINLVEQNDEKVRHTSIFCLLILAQRDENLAYMEGLSFINDLINLVVDVPKSYFENYFQNINVKKIKRNIENTRIFGENLTTILERSNQQNQKIPRAIDSLITAIEDLGTTIPNIFKMEGEEEKIISLIRQIDCGAIPDFTKNFDERVHVLCSLLKKYISSLPEPLLTYNAFDDFIAIVHIPDKNTQIKELMELLEYLPKHNFELLRRLFKLFKRVSKQHLKNKMPSYLLSAIIAPLLLRSRSDPLQVEYNYDSIHQVCYLILENVDLMFKRVDTPGNSGRRLLASYNLKSSFLSLMGDNFKEPNKSDILTEFYIDEGQFLKYLDIIIENLSDDKLEVELGNFKQIKLIHSVIYQQFSKIYSENHERETLDSMDIGSFLQQNVPLFTFYRHFAKDFKQHHIYYQNNKSTTLKDVCLKIYEELGNSNEKQAKMEILQRPFQRLFEFVETLEKLLMTISNNEEYTLVHHAVNTLKDISEYSYLKIADARTEFHSTMNNNQKPDSPTSNLLIKDSMRYPTTFQRTFNTMGRNFEDSAEKNDLIYYTAPMLGFLETNGFLIHQMQIIYHQNEIGHQENKEKEWSKIGEIATENHGKLRATVRKFGNLPKKRPLVWLHLTGTDKRQKDNHKNYQALLKIYELSVNNFADPYLNQLDRDIPMTFPDHPLFREPTPIFEKMKRILVNYPGCNPNFQYFPESTKILGIILIHFPKEEVAFWMFSSLIELLLPLKYYDTKLTGLMLEVSINVKLIESILPKLYKHLEDLKIPLSTIIENWFKKLYLEYLPIETTMRIWDLLFCDGFEIIHRIAIGIFQFNEKVILETSNAVDMNILLDSMPHTIFNVEKLIEISMNLPSKYFTQKNLEKLRKKNESMVQKEILRNLFLGKYSSYEKYGPEWIREDHEFKELMQNDKNEELFCSFIREEFASLQDFEKLSFIDTIVKKISRFQSVPSIQFVWLKELAQEHDREKRYVEAAHCYVHIVSIIFEHYIQEKSELITEKIEEKFNTISFFLKETKTERIYLKNDLQSTYKLPFILDLLEKAAKLFEKGQYFEPACTLSEILTVFYSKTKNRKSVTFHSFSDQMRKSIQMSNEKQDRFFPTFYRIKIFSQILGKEDESQFIYKMPRFCKLYQVVKMIKTMLSQYGEIELIDHSGNVNKSQFSAEKIYVQITSVKPYFEDEEQRITFFDQNDKLRKFFFTTPFVPNEFQNEKSSIETIHVKKTILITEFEFPFIHIRSSIVAEDTIVMTPIENGIRTISDRNKSMEEAILSNRMDQIQLQLQGSVSAGVNGGPMDIVKTFLGNKHKYQEEYVDKLKSECRKFLELCEEAIKKDAQFDKKSEFHRLCVKGYESLTLFFIPYLK